MRLLLLLLLCFLMMNSQANCTDGKELDFHELIGLDAKDEKVVKFVELLNLKEELYRGEPYFCSESASISVYCRENKIFRIVLSLKLGRSIKNFNLSDLNEKLKHVSKTEELIKVLGDPLEKQETNVGSYFKYKIKNKIYIFFADEKGELNSIQIDKETKN